MRSLTLTALLLAALGASTAVSPAAAQTPGTPAAAPAKAIAPLTPVVARVLGGEQDDLASSLLVAPDGATYLVGETKSFSDKTYGDLLVTKLAPDGSLAWARTFGGAADERLPAYLDGRHGGASRAAALGPDGSVYVVGRSQATGSKEPWAAVVLKVTAAGELAWSKVWRPDWANMAKNAASASAVTVAGDRVYVVGSTGAGQTGEEGMVFLASYDAASGEPKGVVAVDPSPTYNDRAFSVVADAASHAVWVSGWNGKTNRGALTRFSTDGDKLALAWTRRVPLANTGSTVCDLDRDAQGNLYLAADVHGASNWIELAKLTADGGFVWARRYNAGATGDVNNTRTVRVLGGKLVVGGRVGLGGTQTHADRKFGDSLLLVYGLDGALERELYHFTGTAQDVVAMDAVTSVGARGKTLYAAGYLWPYAQNHVGEWRDPNGYAVSHPSGDGNASDWQLDDVAGVKTLDLAKALPKAGASLTGLAWKDVTAAVGIGTPKEQSTKGHQTQLYLFAFDGLL